MTSPQTAASRRHRRGFTLVELLTVIAIIGILAGILIPTVGKVRETALRTRDASNIRQIGQAALTYSTVFDGKLPSLYLNPARPNPAFAREQPPGAAPTTNAYIYAAALAVAGGVNDATMWISQSEQRPEAALVRDGLTTVINPDRTDYGLAGVAQNFSNVDLGFAVVAGLVTTAYPPTTPIAFTRGLNEDGTWSDANGAYRNDGGYIAFLGGNVQLFQTLSGTGGGALINTAGARTANIRETLKTGAGGPLIYGRNGTQGNASSFAGVTGTGQ